MPYVRVKRGTVKVKCPVQELDTMSLARARTQTTQSGGERANREATVSPTSFEKSELFHLNIER